MKNSSPSGCQKDAYERVASGQFTAEDIAHDLRFGRGDLLEALYCLHQPSLRRHGQHWLRVLCDLDDNLDLNELVEDYTQEVWFKVADAVGKGAFWRREAQFSTWLYRIAFNHAIDVQRRFKAMVSLNRPVQAQDGATGEELGDTLCDPKAEAAFNFLDADLAAGLVALSEVERQAVLLIDMQGFSVESVARATNTAPSTIYARRTRALKELRSMLAEETA